MKWRRLLTLALALLACCHTASAAEGEVDRVDFFGVKVLNQTILESALEIAPGDDPDSFRIEQTKKNIQTLYESHGYRRAQIKSRVVRKNGELAVEFLISEGHPTRISSVHFKIQGGREARKLPKNYSNLLKARFGLAEGEILDQDKLAEGRRAVQDYLASEEFIGSRVDSVRTTPVKLTLEKAASFSDLEADEWVDLELGVDLGERVSITFRGNEFFSRAYLSGLVDEQRILGLGQDYLTAIKKRIEDAYASSGLIQARVTPYTFEGPNHQKRVTYLIKEGERVRISEVAFEGNLVFKDEELRQQFFARASGIIQNRIYVEKEVQKAADLLIEWLKEKGYLAAKLITIQSISGAIAGKNTPAMKVTLFIYEGDQTWVRKVKISGNRILDQSEIQKILNIQEGTPLNLFSFTQGLEQLKRVYRDHGCLSFQIVGEGTNQLIRYEQENRAAEIRIQLDEGPQFRVSEIEIEGLRLTQPEVVKREVQFDIGDILGEDKLILTERRLRKLGIFSHVNIKPWDDADHPDSKRVKITVHEADRGIFTGGPGIRSDLGVRLFGQLAYTNLWGRNHTASVAASTNRRFYNYHFAEGQLQFAYSWPWFAGVKDLTFRPSLLVGKTQYINFAAENLSLGMMWEKPLLSSPHLVGTFTYSLERINQTLAAEARDNQNLRIGSISPKLTLDLRDQPLAPRSGYYGAAWFDLSFPLLGSQMDPYPVSYYRAQMRSDYFLPLFKDIIWYFSFRTGYEENFQKGSGSIPLIKQFALGGIASLRGYQEQEINRQTQEISGSLAYVNYRTQVDFPFSGDLKLGVFLDAANLLINSYSFTPTYYGTGFGFHYQTPVGPVNFDWGFKLNPAPGQGPYVIHFSIGII